MLYDPRRASREEQKANPKMGSRMYGGRPQEHGWAWSHVMVGAHQSDQGAMDSTVPTARRLGVEKYDRRIHIEIDARREATVPGRKGDSGDGADSSTKASDTETHAHEGGLLEGMPYGVLGPEARQTGGRVGRYRWRGAGSRGEDRVRPKGSKL